MTAETLKDRLVAQALAEGFDACRVCKPGDVPEVPERLAAFLEKGYHGQMSWLAERSHWRGDLPRSGPRRARSSCWPKATHRKPTRWKP